MKKYLLMISFGLILCCGCSKKTLNCSIEHDEDDAITTTNISYNFDFWGKQTEREETRTTTFNTLEECINYYNYLTNLYSDSNYTVEKDESTFSVKVYQIIDFANIDENTLKDIKPDKKTRKNKVSKYYKEMGYNCN